MYSEYTLESDEVLIGRLRQGEQPIMDYLLEKYKKLVKIKAKTMYILGGDNEDLIQEGMIGLFKAIRNYDFGRDASFYTFADLCVSRQMYSAVRASNCQKHLSLNTYISLNSMPFGGNGAEDMELADVVPSGEINDPEKLFLDKERVEYLERKIEEELSDFEKQVLDLYLTGMSYSQIAKVLGRDEKSTDNALQRLKAKIKKLI